MFRSGTLWWIPIAPFVRRLLERNVTFVGWFARLGGQRGKFARFYGSGRIMVIVFHCQLMDIRSGLFRHQAKITASETKRNCLRPNTVVAGVTIELGRSKFAFNERDIPLALSCGLEFEPPSSSKSHSLFPSLKMYESGMALSISSKFPPPYTIKEREESVVVQDATSQPLAYVYCGSAYYPNCAKS